MDWDALPVDESMTSLEPPSLSYTAAGAIGSGTHSNRTSNTRISMEGGENVTEGSGVGEDATSHELASQSDPTTKASSPAIPASESKIGKDGEDGSPDAMLLQTPQVYITFLVLSGRRRTMSFEPETTVGRVKELVWNAWPTGSILLVFSKSGAG